MTDLIVVPQAAQWRRLKSLVLDSVSSPITKRVYNLGLDEFFEWFGREPRPGFTKATVSAWRVALEARGLGAVSINVRITAVRKLAVEAADNGLLAPELAAGITRVKGVASKGVRLGNWLSLKQAQTLLNTPDVSTTKGLRDRAILAVLLGCGLRRSEAAALTFGHVQQRDGRWCIVDLRGKHGRVRTVPMPTWVKVAIDAWATGATITDGPVYRNDLDLVFSNPDGSPLKPNSISATVSALFKRLKISKPKGGSLHLLRHPLASQMLDGGVPLSVVSQRLGHSSVRVTADIYSHAIHGQDDEAVRRWEEYQQRNRPAKPENWKENVQ
jgi:site-specific recombinase XerD